MTLMKAGLALLLTTALTLPAAALDIGLGGKKDRNNNHDRGGIGVSIDRDGVKASVGDVAKAKVSTKKGSIDVDADVGGGAVTAKAKVGGSNGVADLDADIAGTKAKASVLGPNGVANATVKSDLIGGISVSLEALSKKELLKVCADVGGGDACNSGSRGKLLNLIESRLDLLSGTSLANLCLSVGGSGCGGAGGPGGPGGPGAPGAPGGPGGPGVPGGPGAGGPGDGLSEGQRAALQNRCVDIVRKPYKYDAQLIQLCRMLAEL